MNDVIRVYSCENCGGYKLNFALDKLYCQICGKEMKKRRFIEESKQK